jgi:hypothetical protein
MQGLRIHPRAADGLSHDRDEIRFDQLAGGYVDGDVLD